MLIYNGNLIGYNFSLSRAGSQICSGSPVGMQKLETSLPLHIIIGVKTNLLFVPIALVHSPQSYVCAQHKCSGLYWAYSVFTAYSYYQIQFPLHPLAAPLRTAFPVPNMSFMFDRSSWPTRPPPSQKWQVFLARKQTGFLHDVGVLILRNELA